MMTKAKILIVEDELVIAYNVKKILCDDYDCVGVATSYDEALAFFEDSEQHPNLILIDITLKGEKTGLHLAEYIKDQYNIPFVFLTALTDKETIDHILKLDPVAYLAKPILEVNLKTTVALAMKNRKEDFLLKIGSQEYYIDLKNILYAESEHVYVNLYMRNNEKLLLRTSIQNLIEQLPPNLLQRINKSQAINPSSITRKTSSEIFSEFGNFKFSKAYFS